MSPNTMSRQSKASDASKQSPDSKPRQTAENMEALEHARLRDERANLLDRRRDAELQIKERSANVAQAQAKIDKIKNSKTWVLASVLKHWERATTTYENLRHQKTHQMTAVPVLDIVTLKDSNNRPYYRAVQAVPQFRLDTDQDLLPRGWVHLSFKYSGSRNLMAQLAYNAGEGYKEDCIIPLIADEEGNLSQYVWLPTPTLGLRLDPFIGLGDFRLTDVVMREVGGLELYEARQKIIGINSLQALTGAAPSQLPPSEGRFEEPFTSANAYGFWVKHHETRNDDDRQAIAAHQATFDLRPLISVVMPVYNADPEHLRAAIQSVQGQLYDNWELCVADDASTNAATQAVLREEAAKDPRIKVTFRPENGHISAASNSALDLVNGEFVALMDHDDLLPDHALYFVALEINHHPDVDIIYSDEDKINEEGRRYEPYFKTDWNYELFLGQNIISHLGVYRTSLLSEIGGFRLGFEGSQDYDLALRAVGASHEDRIRHIPRVLYHWRNFSSAGTFSITQQDKARVTARQALREHLELKSVELDSVEEAPLSPGYHRVKRAWPQDWPLISLIVPTRDKVDLLKGCVEGLRHKTDYPALEILIVDNGSEEPETLAYFEALREDPRVQVLPYDAPFNFSAINNFAARQAKGDLIGMINNDIEVMHEDWLKEMVSHLLRDDVGAVGAKLYYGDGSIQHGGVVIGMGGVAGHVFRYWQHEDPGYMGWLGLTREVSCCTAACLLVKKSLYFEVGQLDEENFAVAFNDVDFCMKLREAGHKIIWTPHAELYHLESASRGSDLEEEKIDRFKREVQVMEDRWGPTLHTDPHYNPNLCYIVDEFGYAFPPRLDKPWQDFLPSAEEKPGS
ncbi:glycosyltransferase family 2 protein [Rhodovibrionaceae bacterium A322]